MPFCAIQRSRHVRLLHKPKMNLRAPKSLAETFQRDAIFRIRKIGNFSGSNGKQDNLLVQYFVMFEIVKKR